MIVSETVRRRTEEKLGVLLERAGAEKRRELLERLDEVRAQESEAVAFALGWILANSPLSDLANYAFDLFLSSARHGVFLREHSPFAKDLPLDIFLNYVLHIRVNEEELCDCRGFFYEALAQRINHLPMRQAILETNYWCAEHVMYQSTDSRTISALGAYRSGYGRCGEESAFGVNVLRAVGIPARQIYTPRWAHCDDNHAWVEVYCDGAWHFLGACEPEEVLNRGWFTNASSRAMLIHSRCFGEIENEEIISRVGKTAFLNNLKLYAVTKELSVVVRDAAGKPVEGAEVAFGILNYSELYDAAVVKTDREGRARLTCGLGSLNIRVKKDGICREQLVYTPDTDCVGLTLEQEQLPCGVWQDFVFIAPRDQIVNGEVPTEAQKALCQEKTARANAEREAYTAAMFRPQAAQALVERFGYSREIYELLAESRSNGPRLMEFLADEDFSPEEKEALLLTLSRKDRRDVEPELLRQALRLTADYPIVREDVFYPYVVCPRVWDEPLTDWRPFILNYFTREQKAEFRADPRSVWAYIQQEIGFDASVEYGQIVTCPVGALTVRNANPMSRKILFVAICRSLGIPARMNPVNEQLEFYEGGRFVPVEAQKPCTAALVLHRTPGECWQYGTDFGIGMLVDGSYQQLNLEGAVWEGDELRIPVNPGFYRVLTDNRLPNGNLHASKYHLEIGEGETAQLSLHRHGADLREMLDHYRLDEFRVADAQGKPVLGSALTERKAVLMWLEEGKEPTEHILNEMLEQAGDFAQLPARIIFLVRSQAALENAKLRQVLQTFPEISVYYDSFVPNVETLARRMYVDPEKLPLILVTTGSLDAIYASSGYNVGSGDMIVRICESF